MKYSPAFVHSKYRIRTHRELEKAVKREEGEVLQVAVGTLSKRWSLWDRAQEAIEEKSEGKSDAPDTLGAIIDAIVINKHPGSMFVHEVGTVALDMSGVDFEYTRILKPPGESKVARNPLDIVPASEEMVEALSTGGAWNGIEEIRLGYSRYRSITPRYHDRFNGVEPADVMFNLSQMRAALAVTATNS